MSQPSPFVLHLPKDAMVLTTTEKRSMYIHEGIHTARVMARTDSAAASRITALGLAAGLTHDQIVILLGWASITHGSDQVRHTVVEHEIAHIKAAREQGYAYTGNGDLPTILGL